MTIAAHIVSLLLVVVESLFDSSDAVARDEFSASAVSAHPLTKDFHFGKMDHREYPIRTYRGINDEQGQVWLTCDIKGRYEDL